MPRTILSNARRQLDRARLLAAQAERKLDKATSFTSAAEERADRLQIAALEAALRSAGLRRHLPE
jgi:hypothetical protein